MEKDYFQNHTILLVEGDTDVIFIQALLEMIDFKDVITTDRDHKTPRPTTQERLHLHESGGEAQLVKTFGEIVRDLKPELETNQDIKLRQIVVLIDGDETQTGTQKLTGFNKKLKAARFRTKLTKINIMEKDPNYEIQFGVYVLKDFTDNTFQDLESLLYSLLKDESLRKCLESYLQCVGMEENDKYIYKRKIGVLLPVLKEFEGNGYFVLRKYFEQYFKTNNEVEAGHPLTKLIDLLQNIKANSHKDNTLDDHTH